MSLILRYVARSDRGLIREGNEDSVYAGPRLLAVADGMGGMAAGEVASNIVVATLAPLDEDPSSVDLVETLRDSINSANEQLRDAVADNSELEGMGTTLTAMLFSGQRLALAHVGDSRAYLLRNDKFQQITRDDTYVQMLIDEGRITEEEASSHPQRSLLTRALDGREIEPDFSIRPAQAGDRYLLCSDGLSSVVSADTIAEALAIPDLSEAADRLIALALRGGGPDNITCIVADIVDASEITELDNDSPIVAGAAAHDRGRTSSASNDSAAGRAALARPATQTDTSDENNTVHDSEKPKKSRRFRWIFGFLAVVLIIVAVSGWLGWRYTNHQYYVGATDDQKVAIFRGFSGSIAGIKLSTIEATSSLELADLEPEARRRVKEGITASNLEDAQRIAQQLEEKTIELCSPNSSPSATPSSTPQPSTSASQRQAKLHQPQQRQLQRFLQPQLV